SRHRKGPRHPVRAGARLPCGPFAGWSRHPRNDSYPRRSQSESPRGLLPKLARSLRRFPPDPRTGVCPRPPAQKKILDPALARKGVALRASAPGCAPHGPRAWPDILSAAVSPAVFRPARLRAAFATRLLKELPAPLLADSGAPPSREFSWAARFAETPRLRLFPNTHTRREAPGKRALLLFPEVFLPLCISRQARKVRGDCPDKTDRQQREGAT